MQRNQAVRQQGFTLLEVLVVVALIALASAILVPALLRVNTGDQVATADKLADTLTELSERSLFLGQITALRLDAHGYTPLYYAIDSEKFEPFNDSDLVAQVLPDDQSLNWQADDAALTGQLQTGMHKQQNDEDDKDSARSSTKSDTQDADALPQIFFLPGGQSSSGILTISDEDEHQQRLQLDPLGQVVHLDKSDTAANASLPPLLLPDDASFYQSQGAGQ